ncbi:MAG: cupin domain-containing protein [Candidatus Dormiibacterota bacterium]
MPRDAQPDALVIPPFADRLEHAAAVQGAHLVIREWAATGVDEEVAPLHVHIDDDEAWHVISGALRFRLADRVFIAAAGATVLVPAGVAHTFGNAGPAPSRYIFIVPARVDELISRLHEVDRKDHPRVYAEHRSQLVE